MATKDQATEQLNKDNEARAKHLEEGVKRMQSRPTPTQAENDLAALGVPLESHEDDGSGGEVNVDLTRRVVEPSNPSHSGGYRTRHVSRSGETPSS